MTKDWFTSRVGRTVRFTFDYLGTKIDKQRTIKDDREAGYLWLMSERGYKFEEVSNMQNTHNATVAENAPTDDWLSAIPAVKPRVHSGPPESVCISCEG